jgi:uncharacterized cupredoxin-like copper-binding protein
MIALALLSLTLAACSSGSSNAVTKPNRDGVVMVTMTDDRYSPSRIEVPAGQAVVYRFTNNGTVPHEAVIGTMSQQRAHEAEMQQSATTMPMSSQSTAMPSTRTTMPMAAGQSNTDTVRVMPHQTAELRYTAEKGQVLWLGCHEPGHWAAGMRASITIR